MITHLLPQDCSIYRNTVASRAANNDPVNTRSLVATVKCRLSLKSAKERFEPHGATITELKIYLPDCDVQSDDVLCVDGVDYRVIGIFERTGFTLTNHIEVDVEKVGA